MTDLPAAASDERPTNPLCGCPDTPYGTHHDYGCRLLEEFK